MASGSSSAGRGGSEPRVIGAAAKPEPLSRRAVLVLTRGRDKDEDGRLLTLRPLPCWWSLVVGAGGWASCCGHDVLPLSLDDPGGVVTRSSRALVTADKGNGPQCVRSFVTWVRDRLSTG